MQQTSIDAYETSLLNLLNTTATKANLATIQQYASDLETNKSQVISEQNATEQSGHLISMLENDVFNCIIKSGKLIQCYNDYDNVIATETIPDVKASLTEEK